MRVIIFSRTFPAYHPKSGQPTHFVEKVLESLYPDIVGWDGFYSLKEKGFDIGLNNIYQPKYHTIRAGNRWKVGDKFSPRVWSGRPYQSKQIQFAPEIEVKKTWKYEVKIIGRGIEQWIINGTQVSQSNEHMHQWFNHGLIEEIASNDGLILADFLNWFKHPSPFSGQIICWSNKIEY